MNRRSQLIGRSVGLAALMTFALGQNRAEAQTFRLDGLLAVLDATSPCTAVTVKVFEEGKLKNEAAVLPDGKVKALGNRGALPQFQKGKTYRLQATCVSLSGAFQNSELSFRAEGRTTMVVFTKSGFQFKRGGLAY